MNRPLRICMVTTFYPPYNFGGDGIFVERLSRELAARGHHVEVIHCTDAYRLLAPKGREPAVEEHPGIVVHRLKSPFGPFSPLATQQTGRPLFKTAAIRRILARGFDVVHFHNVSLVGGPGVLELGDAVKLYTLHEFWLICPTHILFRFNREICTERTCLACQLVYRRPPQLWRYTSLVARAVRHVDMFISPDRHTIGRHREQLGDIPITYLPHFVPDVPLAPHGKDAPPYFLFAGRLEKLKGLQDVIPVFREHPKAALWIAGTGAYEPELRSLAAGSSRIKFLGHQSGSRFQELYRQAVAVIVPSVNYEVAPPLVIMEAYRQQTPALVRNLGSMPEIIDDSGGGFVWNDLRELRAQVDQLLDDREFRDGLGMRGYMAYRERWTADAHLTGYFRIIEEARAARALRTGRETPPATSAP